MTGSGYRMIALDMDGTLLTSGKTVHPDSVRDIRYAVDRGIHVVFCTGRGLAEMRDYLEPLSMVRYAVCVSGALVYDLHGETDGNVSKSLPSGGSGKNTAAIGGRTISLRGIPDRNAREILRVAQQYDAMPQLLTEKESIVRADQISRMGDYHMAVYQEMYERLARTTQNIAEELERGGGIAKINLYFRNTEDRERGCRELQNLPLDFAYAEGTSLEMNASGVTKASGLKILADHLGIGMTEVIGMGDAENDTQMLRSVGCSVAMGNADERIRAICDLVTDDNDHNGVGKAIRRLCGS